MAVKGLPPKVELPRVVFMTRFMLHPDKLLDRAYREHGDFFHFVTPLDRTMCVTANPETIKQVFRGDPEIFRAGEANAMLGPLVGPHSTLLLDGAEHLRHRKLLLPPFHGERMREYGELMAEVAERHVSVWPKDQPFSAIESTQAITLEVIQRAVFGIEDGGRLDHVARLLRAVLDPMSNRWQMLTLMLAPSSWGPRSPWGRFRQRVREADEAIYEEIRARKADPATADRGDVMSLLLQARDEDGEPLSDKELRDELVTLLVAGHETTATALSWAAERLVRMPGGWAALRQGGEEYAEAAGKEALRLRPVLPIVLRHLQAPMTIAGLDLPAGVVVAPSIYLVHRRAELYPEPERFRPERFLGSNPQGGTYTWIPFGGGVRRCLGAPFAQLEIRTVMQTVLAQATLHAPDPAPERIRLRHVTLVPSRDALVVMDGRQAKPAPAAPATTYA
jgi:cytochrome P450 family 135